MIFMVEYQSTFEWYRSNEGRTEDGSVCEAASTSNELLHELMKRVQWKIDEFTMSVLMILSDWDSGEFSARLILQSTNIDILMVHFENNRHIDNQTYMYYDHISYSKIIINVCDLQIIWSIHGSIDTREVWFCKYRDYHVRISSSVLHKCILHECYFEKYISFDSVRYFWNIDFVWKSIEILISVWVHDDEDA